MDDIFGYGMGYIMNIVIVTKRSNFVSANHLTFPPTKTNRRGKGKIRWTWSRQDLRVFVLAIRFLAFFTPRCGLNNTFSGCLLMEYRGENIW